MFANPCRWVKLLLQRFPVILWVTTPLDSLARSDYAIISTLPASLHDSKHLVARGLDIQFVHGPLEQRPATAVGSRPLDKEKSMRSFPALNGHHSR